MSTRLKYIRCKRKETMDDLESTVQRIQSFKYILLFSSVGI